MTPDTPARPSEETMWLASCGGSFFQANACGKCPACQFNLKKIKDLTPLGKEIDALAAQLTEANRRLAIARQGLVDAICGLTGHSHTMEFKEFKCFECDAAKRLREALAQISDATGGEE